ncbi:uncharacterized protein [Rhodnius prolixus]|uniref:uncharacterized protein n=1 Tax=Rhodnius prolixus TaxID=13249 RepID=UPI003D18ADE1
MGANVFNKFTMIEIERRLKYHKEKARSRNSDAAMIASVKRNLFGTRAGENKNQIQHEMAVIAQHDIKRWNFDFNKEKPIYTDAQFDWKFSYETKEAQLRQTKITDFFIGKRKANTSIGRKAKQPRLSLGVLPQVLIPK